MVQFSLNNFFQIAMNDWWVCFPPPFPCTMKSFPLLSLCNDERSFHLSFPSESLFRRIEPTVQGFSSFQKSYWEFSQLGLDQVHEQNNAVIKGSGGASDLLNKVHESALLRWEVCNPVVACLLLEFDDGMNVNSLWTISDKASWRQ